MLTKNLKPARTFVEKRNKVEKKEEIYKDAAPTPGFNPQKETSMVSSNIPANKSLHQSVLKGLMAKVI